MQEPNHKNASQRDAKGIALVVQALSSATEHYPFAFAVFSRKGNVEYLFGYGERKAEFLGPAQELCENGYLLMGAGVSTNFYDWATFDFGFGETSFPGLTRQILGQALAFVLGEDGPAHIQ